MPITNLSNTNIPKASEQIDPQKVYFIRQKGQMNPIAQKYGKDWIKESEIKLRIVGKKKFYSWVDFLNSGKLPIIHAPYEILVHDENNYLICIFSGRAGYIHDELESTLSDSPAQANEQSKAIVPISQAYERNSLRTLADTMQFQNNQTVSTLQDELRSKDEFIRQVQADMNVAYQSLQDREREFFAEKNKLIEENSKLQKEIETLKREFEIEKIKFELEKISFERSDKLKKEIEKLKLEQTNKTDWVKTLKDVMPVLSGLAPMLSGGKIQIPMMAQMPDYDDDEEATNESSE